MVVIQALRHVQMLRRVDTHLGGVLEQRAEVARVGLVRADVLRSENRIEGHAEARV